MSGFGMPYRQRQSALSPLGHSASGPTGAVIEFTAEHLEKLEQMRDEQWRRDGGVRTKPLTERELLDMLRCQNCGVRCKNHMKKSKMIQNEPKLQENRPPNPSRNDAPDAPTGTPNSDRPRPQTMRCKYHAGTYQYRKWTCCGSNVLANSWCKREANHDPQVISMEVLKERYQVHSTPRAPASLGITTIRHAVAIDCEMGTSVDNDPEVIRLTVIDYFTSEILVDSLVWPDPPMSHYNTKYSGVSRRQIEAANRAGSCIRGIRQARESVWKYVGPYTIVVGHSLTSDLGALRWLHINVVDSFSIEQEIHKYAQRVKQAEEEKKRAADIAAGIPPPQKALKEETNGRHLQHRKKDGPLKLSSLAASRLGIKVQQGNKGHDSVEDALTARDLVAWHVQRRFEGRDLIAEARASLLEIQWETEEALLTEYEKQ